MFRSTSTSPHGAAPPHTVRVNGLWAAEIAPPPGGAACTSHLSIVLKVNPGDAVPTLVAQAWIERLRQRIALYERVACDDFDRYYGSQSADAQNEDF